MSTPKLRPVHVKKNKATRRDMADPSAMLMGKLRLICKVLEEVDGIPNFLHIGSGEYKLSYDEKALKALETKVTDLKGLIEHLQGQPEILRAEYMDIVRYANKPCIPGSSIKGTVRARLELSFTAEKGVVYSCFHSADRLSYKNQPGWFHFKLWMPATQEQRNNNKVCNATAPYNKVKVCATCNLLGAPGLASRIFFGNLEHVKGHLVRLELDRGEKIIAFAPGSVFQGDITFLGLRDEELGLLLVGLGANENGIFVPILMGKSKYRCRKVIKSEPPDWTGKTVRFGVLKIEVQELNIIDFGFSTKLIREELRQHIADYVIKAKEKFPGLKIGISEAEKATVLLNKEVDI